MFDINIRWWQDSNHGPLITKVITLPTEPQPLQNIFTCSLNWKLVELNQYKMHYLLLASASERVNSLSERDLKVKISKSFLSLH